MAITLTPDQEAWLSARVDAGDFPSIDDAARRLIDDRIAELDIEQDDLTWAKTCVDEGLAQFERGEFITVEEHESRNDRRLAALKRR